MFKWAEIGFGSFPPLNLAIFYPYILSMNSFSNVVLDHDITVLIYGYILNNYMTENVLLYRLVSIILPPGVVLHVQQLSFSSPLSLCPQRAVYMSQH